MIAENSKRWEIDLHYEAIVTTVVEANSEKEAIEKAIKANGRYIDNVELAYSKAAETDKEPDDDSDMNSDDDGDESRFV